MTTVNYKIDNPIVTDLERLHYEFESYRAIIGYILTQGLDVSNETFKAYQNDFSRINKEYLSLKDYMTNEIVKKEYPEAINWSMDFPNSTVVVTLP